MVCAATGWIAAAKPTPVPRVAETEGASKSSERDMGEESVAAGAGTAF